MNLTFDFFERILMGELNPIVPETITNTQFLADFLFKNEISNIQKKIRKQVFDAATSDEIAQIVQCNYQRFLSLSFRTLKSIGNIKDFDLCNNAENFFSQLTFNEIENILQFLECEYFDYIDKSFTIPYQSSLYDKKITQNQIATLEQYLQNIGLPSKLLLVILEPLTLLSSINLQNRISYQQLDYCLNYLNEWSKNIQNKSKLLTEEKIISMLIILNQNSIESFDFITFTLRDKIEDFFSTIEKIDFIRWEIKLLKQMKECYSPSFNKNLPPLKTQIINWLDEEMNYWIEKPNVAEFETIIPKVCTTFSVAELGLFLRLQYESGMLKTDNQRELVKFVASSFQTEKTKEISSKSLLSKYYTIETGSKKEVKQKLKTMIDLLNEW